MIYFNKYNLYYWNNVINILNIIVYYSTHLQAQSITSTVYQSTHAMHALLTKYTLSTQVHSQRVHVYCVAKHLTRLL